MSETVPTSYVGQKARIMDTDWARARKLSNSKVQIDRIEGDAALVWKRNPHDSNELNLIEVPLSCLMDAEKGE